ncbi:MAG TPA: hypothetical protein VJ952_05445 [Opitutales bacterium]|nr:hypothetical protein [Opitutales bacterium]
MPKPTSKLTWCKARLGEDMNWWVHDTSDPLHWDVDGLGIIDPRQFQHLIDLIEPLQDYGLQNELVDDAFYSFSIDKVEKDKTVLLKRVKDSILESEEQLFALPDVLDEDKGPYADLLDHLTKLRIKMLNDLIDFSQSLTVEELEEEIREQQTGDYMEGKNTHFFAEITSILEYVPEGFELEDDEPSPKSKDEELEEDLSDIETDEVDEKIEEDDTMKWDEEEEEEEDYDEPTSPPEEEKKEK